jgi:7-carboxy-7-deazaguanine synthase (Cx14CxxC type)
VYKIKEIFYTLQGEGANAGKAAVFCRFAGCNLWSGREKDRSSAICQFCDTDFVGTDGTRGGKFQDADVLAETIVSCWPRERTSERFVVCTGGEPLLQLDFALIRELHVRGFKVAVETNGTCSPPPGLDWICVSPKAGAGLAIRTGDELKVVFPQDGLEPQTLESLAFRHFFLQPMDGPHLKANTAAAVSYCLANPKWRLGLQTHKFLDLR